MTKCNQREWCYLSNPICLRPSAQVEELTDAILELWKLTPNKYASRLTILYIVCCIVMNLRFRTYWFRPMYRSLIPKPAVRLSIMSHQPAVPMGLVICISLPCEVSESLAASTDRKKEWTLYRIGYCAHATSLMLCIQLVVVPLFLFFFLYFSGSLDSLSYFSATPSSSSSCPNFFYE